MRTTSHDTPSPRPATATTDEIERWAALSERYFEAATTEAEERALRRFLLSPASQDARFDELRAVMAFAAAGRASATRTAERPRRGIRPAGRLLRWSAAAAVAALLLLPAALRRIPGPDDVCVAYIGGERVTRHDIVLENMHETLRSIMATDDDYSVERQLDDMLETLDGPEAAPIP